jgi:hypothetical protein
MPAEHKTTVSGAPRAGQGLLIHGNGLSHWGGPGPLALIWPWGLSVWDWHGHRSPLAHT